MRAVFLDRYALNPGDLDTTRTVTLCDEVDFYDRTETFEDTVKRIGNAEIVVTNKAPITREVLEACPNIKYVTVTATGYNIIDLDACRDHGVIASNVPGYSTASVSQHIFALLLEITNHVSDHSAAVSRGRWQECPDYTFSVSKLSELDGKTMGFIGMGAIGSRAARIAQALGMKAVCYHSRSHVDGVDHLSLDELLAVSDIVSLCCPVTAENQNLINRDTIAKMKDGAILINTARGGLIDEEALAEALHSGKIYAAGLDVLKTEPPKNSSPLINAPNCYITPHIAWAPRETRARLLWETEENILAFLRGEKRNCVN
ncbi:MAG: D-2-hydroxyacid dehydrogenase [Clostridia bacterium]|nr:D-2-hydroxyacid dehydrogenase [Clostridia bacterium]